MAISGLMDFWRRRKLYIIVAIVFLLMFAAFVHIKPRKPRSRHVEKLSDTLTVQKQPQIISNPDAKEQWEEGNGRKWEDKGLKFGVPVNADEKLREDKLFEEFRDKIEKEDRQDAKVGEAPIDDKGIIDAGNELGIPKVKDTGEPNVPEVKDKGEPNVPKVKDKGEPNVPEVKDKGEPNVPEFNDKDDPNVPKIPKPNPKFLSKPDELKVKLHNVLANKFMNRTKIRKQNISNQLWRQVNRPLTGNQQNQINGQFNNIQSENQFNHPWKQPKQPENQPNQLRNRFNWPNQPRIQPNQPRIQPNQLSPNQFNQPRNQFNQNQFNQPRNQFNQFGNQFIQPNQPRNQFNQQYNQLKNQFNQQNQPVNQFNQPNQPRNQFNQPDQPRNQFNQPDQPRNQFNQPNQPRNQLNQPNQAGNLPRSQLNLPNQPADNQNQSPMNVPIDAQNHLRSSRNQPDQSNNEEDHLPSNMLYVHSSTPTGRPLNSQRTKHQEAVVQAFKHAWKAYKEYAWGQDEVNPISHIGVSSTFSMGLTLVDSLDTMWLMGLEEEFNDARKWVADNLNFNSIHNTVSLFETTIRVLGALLSTYHLSGDSMFLNKAVELGNKLLPAFNTASGIPSGTVSLHDGLHNGKIIAVAEAGSLQLEFRDLSRATGNPAFRDAGDQAMNKTLSQMNGMVSQTLNSKTGRFSGAIYTAGAGVDSFYEYLLKQWIQSSMTEGRFQKAYVRSVDDVLRNLLDYSLPSHMAFLGTKYNRDSATPSPNMDHLTCFYPGMLALGILYDLTPDKRGVAKNLTHTCYYMYNSTTPTGLAPEVFYFNRNPAKRVDILPSPDSRNFQRPETVESLFYLYRLTKDNRYRQWGWRIFQSFEKYTKIKPYGYVGLKNVFQKKNYLDRMESFFLAETLKYLYLLFGDDDSVLSLKEWVFNTEAHPLPIWNI